MVDSLDTMQMSAGHRQLTSLSRSNVAHSMGLSAHYNEALQQISKTDFTAAKSEVNVFETTIRCALALFNLPKCPANMDRPRWNAVCVRAVRQA